MKRAHPLFVSVLLAVAAFALGWARPAGAQTPPPNDDIANATPFSTLPFQVVDLDTSGATTSATDPDCAGNGATVWYEFTPTADADVFMNTFGSNYDTTLSVYTGTASSLSQIACNDDAGSGQSVVTFHASAGTTYFIMVGAFDSQPGGNLVLTAQVAPVSAQINATFDARTGAMLVTTTVSCTTPEIIAFVVTFVQQRAGRLLLTSSAFDDVFVECDPAQPVIVQQTLPPQNGLFRGGPVTVFSDVVWGESFVPLHQEVTVTARGR